MAQKEIWFGSSGPYLYDDQDTYPDGNKLRGFRADQMRIDQEPTEDTHVARNKTIRSTAERDKRYSLILS